MRSGCLSALRLVSSIGLLAAFAASGSGATDSSQALLDSHAIGDAGEQCAATPAVAAVLLQRQTASVETGPTEMRLVSEHDRPDGQKNTDQAVAALPPHVASAESIDSLPVSLMTFASESRPARPLSGVTSVMLSTGNKKVSVARGKLAPLNEMGYKSVAKLKSQKEMETFVKRVIDDQGLYIVDEGSLKGLVPYYSGKKATQSFRALANEISKAEKKKRLVKGKMIYWVTRNPKGEWKDKMSELDVGKRKKSKSGAFVQTGTATSETRPERKRSHHKDSLVQTKASSRTTWIVSLLGFFEGQAIFWLGARITIVACAGSLLFGLFLRDECEHDARAAGLLSNASPEDGLHRLPPMSSGGDLPASAPSALADKRPGAKALRQADPWRGLSDSLRPQAPRQPATPNLSLLPTGEWVERGVATPKHAAAFPGETAAAAAASTEAAAPMDAAIPKGSAVVEWVEADDTATPTDAMVAPKETAAARLQALQSAKKEASPVFEAWRAKAAATLAATSTETTAGGCTVVEEISGSTAAPPETAKETPKPCAEPLAGEVSANTTEAAADQLVDEMVANSTEAATAAGEAPQGIAAEATSAEALGAMDSLEGNVVAHEV